MASLSASLLTEVVKLVEEQTGVSTTTLGEIPLTPVVTVEESVDIETVQRL